MRRSFVTTLRVATFQQVDMEPKDADAHRSESVVMYGHTFNKSMDQPGKVAAVLHVVS